jgi:hypothetical protein
MEIINTKLVSKELLKRYKEFLKKPSYTLVVNNPKPNCKVTVSRKRPKLQVKK